MRAGIAQEQDGGLVHSPFPSILVFGASDAEVGEIESLCLSRNILVTPGSFEQVVQGRKGENTDAVVLSLNALDSASGSKVDQLRSLGLPILCILPPQEIINTDLLSDLSVDDFVFRPYRSEELLCRLRVLLARRKHAISLRLIEKRRQDRRQSDRKDPSSKATLLTRNSLIIDPETKHVILNGKGIRLTPREYSLLALLGSHPGRVVSSEEIIEQTWGDEKRANASDVQQYIHLLRKKIESDPKQPRWIITVTGFGYKLKIPD